LVSWFRKGGTWIGGREELTAVSESSSISIGFERWPLGLLSVIEERSRREGGDDGETVEKYGMSSERMVEEEGSGAATSIGSLRCLSVP
jgi:hypothetical protein